MGKIKTKAPVKKVRSLIGDWSKLNPRVAVIGFFCFIVGLAFLASGKLDQELIGLGVFVASLGLGYYSLRNVWE